MVDPRTENVAANREEALEVGKEQRSMEENEALHETFKKGLMSST